MRLRRVALVCRISGVRIETWVLKGHRPVSAARSVSLRMPIRWSRMPRWFATRTVFRIAHDHQAVSSPARPPRHRHDLHHQTPIRSGSNRSRPSTMTSSPLSAPAPTSTRSSPARDSTPPCTSTFNWTHKPVGPTGCRGIQPTSFWVEPDTDLGRTGQRSGANRVMSTGSGYNHVTSPLFFAANLPGYTQMSGNTQNKSPVIPRAGADKTSTVEIRMISGKTETPCRNTREKKEKRKRGRGREKREKRVRRRRRATDNRQHTDDTCE